MGRRKSGERVLGPYSERGGKQWRVVLVIAGERVTKKFTSRAKAQRYINLAKADLASTEHDTDSAREEFEKHLKREGNKQTTIDGYMYALKAFFPEPLPLDLLSKRRCEKLYDALKERLAVDSHRNYLKQTKTFLRWCVSKGWISSNPAEEIKGSGSRNRGGKGKRQLTNAEARRYLAKGLELIASGDERALAALLPLLLSVSGSEITDRVVRDLDDDNRPGGVFRVTDGKTDSRTRRLTVPEIVRPALLALVIPRASDAPLFCNADGSPHRRWWPTEQVKRLCRLAGVPEVTSHGLRGTCATLAEDAGAAAELVVAQLGHGSYSVTQASYTKSETPARREQERALKVLQGGRKG